MRSITGKLVEALADGFPQVSTIKNHHVGGKGLSLDPAPEGQPSSSFQI